MGMVASKGAEKSLRLGRGFSFDEQLQGIPGLGQPDGAHQQHGAKKIAIRSNSSLEVDGPATKAQSSILPACSTF